MCHGPCNDSSVLFFDVNKYQLYLNNALYEHKYDHDAFDAPFDNNYILKELEDYLNVSLFNAFIKDHNKPLDDLNESLYKPLIDSPLDSLNNFSNESL